MTEPSPPRLAAHADGALDDRCKRDARYLHLLNSDLFGVGIGDFSGNIHDANQSFLDTFGCTRDELERGLLRWTDMTAAEYQSLDEMVLRKARARAPAGRTKRK